MPIQCSYLHTNLTVKNIVAMQAFYTEVFGCVPVREIECATGEWIENITSVEGGQIKYVHLRFPGYDQNGPELELIQYLTPAKKYDITADTYGFGHISFSVDNVQTAVETVINAGGKLVGEVVSVNIPRRGLLTEAYVTDPEGNMIELQHYA